MNIEALRVLCSHVLQQKWQNQFRESVQCVLALLAVFLLWTTLHSMYTQVLDSVYTGEFAGYASASCTTNATDITCVVDITKNLSKHCKMHYDNVGYDLCGICCSDHVCLPKKVRKH